MASAERPIYCASCLQQLAPGADCPHCPEPPWAAEVRRRLDRYRDPDWRDHMPLRWRLERWWWIHKPAVATLAVLLAVLVACLVWLAKP